MFKRVEKRRRKLEKEEKLGLTEEMKEVLGMHDTDSDESESESDEGSLGEGSGTEDEGNAVMQDVEVDEEALNVVAEGEGDEDEDEDEGENEGDEDAEEEDHQRPPLSVTEAIADPIYSLSTKSFLKACAVCPAKRFRDEKFIEEHRNSKVSSTVHVSHVCSNIIK